MMGWMTLIADLHGRTPPIRPDSYLVLLAGDIAPDKDQQRWLDTDFRRWLASLSCPCVAVPGNHDRAIEEGRCPPDLPWTLLGEGQHGAFAGVTVFGMTGVLDAGVYCRSEKDFEEQLSYLPDRCDVLLAHNPPLGILDRPSAAHHLGSLALRWACWKKKPRLVVFGHAHEARGHQRLDGTYYVNATLGAGCNGTGRPILAPHTPWGLSDSSWRSS